MAAKSGNAWSEEHAPARAGNSLPVVTFHKLLNGKWELFAALEGTPPKHIPHSGGYGEDSAISPSRGEVAVLLDRHRLAVTNLSTWATRHLNLDREVATDYAHPAWIDDDTLVVTGYRFDHGEETAAIYRIDLATGSVRILLNHTGIPDFAHVSPDGSHVVYSVLHSLSVKGMPPRAMQQLWVANLRTGMGKALVTAPGQHLHGDWSPDGKLIAFASDMNGQFEVWTVNPKTGELQQLTKGAGSKIWPRWSPDGTNILFQRISNNAQELWKLNVKAGTSQAFHPFENQSTATIRDPDWQ